VDLDGAAMTTADLDGAAMTTADLDGAKALKDAGKSCPDVRLTESMCATAPTNAVSRQGRCGCVRRGEVGPRLVPSAQRYVTPSTA
jgi:hypothetical protein